MKRSLLVARALAIALAIVSLGSCELLFGGKNLFSGLDGPDVGSLTTATGTDLIDALNEEKGGETDSFGDTFVEQVTNDPGAVTTIYDNLEDIFNDTTKYSPDDRAEAASLAGDLILATSDTAGPVIDNVVSAVLSLTQNSETEDFTADQLVVEMLNTIAPGEDSFISLVHDLGLMARAYDALGAALVAGGSTELDPGDGQAALIAFTLTEIVNAVQVTGDTAAKAAALYNSLIGPALRGEVITGAINTLFRTGTPQASGKDNLQAVFESVLDPGEGTPRDTLYEATDIASLIDLLGGD